MASPESVINGRFKFLERPAVAPGKCAVCGSVERPVIDFGFDVDYYGTVYICVTCLTEAAGIAGIVSSSSSQVAPLPIDYEGLNEFFRAAGNAFDRINLIVPDYVVSLMVNQENGAADDGVGDESIPEPQGPNDSQPEPISIEGPNDGPESNRSLVSGF